MHDLSFFLLKNWLPVGVSAIVFFGIGLLLAKMTWGRYTQRLSYAVEENMNLASQWSALGASQRDLFKRLRVRWQADRDSWESTLADKEQRITALTRQLTSSGKEIPAELKVDEGLKDKIKELEAALEREKAAHRQWREEVNKGPVVSPVAKAMAAAAPIESAEAVAAAEFQTRIRDLEQDLIDTHDELHDMRVEYQKQLALVEALEAKLIENPVGKSADELAFANEKIAGLEARLEAAGVLTLAQAAEVAQWKALLPQRGREMRGLRSQFLSLKQSGAEAITGLKGEFAAREEVMASEFAALEATLASEFAEREESLKAEFAEGLETLKAEFAAKEEEFAAGVETLKAEFAAKEEELAAGMETLKAEFAAKEEEFAAGVETLKAEFDGRAEEFAAGVETLKAEFDGRAEALASEKEALKAEFAAHEENLLAAHHAERTELEETIVTLTGEVEQRRGEIAALEADLLAKSGALDEAGEKIAELEVLQRRKASLQSELNDACHEMYDVRRALNLRLAEISTLETRISELDTVQARNEELTRQLEDTREELAGALHTVSETGDQLKNLTEELADLHHTLSKRTLESESLQSQLTDARHELSDVRIAYNAGVADYQKALAQMEELEAIIEDRSAEVNDLSTELRTQRDLVRQLKNTLAEAEGELEALNDESRVLNAGFTAKTAFVEEQRVRIADLELALSQRYHELNAVRAESDESSRHARYLEAHTRHLEAELDRRRDEFAASDKRITTAEEAVEAANAKIAALSGQLEQSSASLAQLQEDLRQVSRDKDDTIRELDRATQRIAQLEEAAALRETQLAAISEELNESTRQAGDLDIRLNRLTTELETAREEQEVSRLGIGELEEALRSSDERTLQLSARLEEKESEVTALLGELETLRNSIEAREANEVEARARLEEKESVINTLIAELDTLRSSLETSVAGESEARARFETLQTEHESKLALASEEYEVMTTQQREEADRLTAEINALRETIEEQRAKLETETEQRTLSLAEVEALREKLEQRAESIRELQDQLSTIMLQRASRDNEISVLKEKLHAVEMALSEAREAEARRVEALAAAIPFPPTDDTAPASSHLVDEASLAAAIHRSLTAEASGEEEGIPLDELVGKTIHHHPQHTAEVTPEPVPEPVPAPPAPVTMAVESNGKQPGTVGDDDRTVYFNEGTATLSIAELEKIDLCARAIRRFGRKVEVTVVGYAGAEGNPDQNERLSARRADAVRERLLEKGVSQGLVTVRGGGQDRRFTDWKARRVELIVAPVAVAEAVN